MNERARDTGNLRDFLTIIFKHKAKITMIFFAIVLAVTAGSFLLPPVYEAKSDLLVKFGREYIYHSEVGGEERNPPPVISQEETVNSEINILKSPDLIEKVIKAIKIENIYPELLASTPWMEDIGLRTKMTPLQAAVIKFEKGLKVEAVRRSSVIEVSFRHKDAKTAAMAVNLLDEFYREKHLQVYSGFQSSFLGKQLAFYDGRLKGAEDELEAFKQKNRVYSLDEQRSLLLKQRMELDSQMKDAQNHVDGLRQRLFSLKKELKKLSEDKNIYTRTDRDRIIVDARGKLLDLRLEEQKLLGEYNESNPLIQNVRKEIAITSDFLRRQELDIAGKVKTGNPVYQGVRTDALRTEADLTSELARRGTLGLQLGQVDGEVRSLDLKGKELENLELEKDIYDRNYRTYAEKMEEARISDDMNRRKMANVSVIQEAMVPAEPVRPDKLLNIFAGIVLGVVSGTGYALLSEYYSQGLSTPEIAEKRLGLPVLATVEHMK